MSDVAQNKQSDKTDKARRRFLNVWTIVGAIALTWVVVQLLNILSVPVAIVIWTTVIVFVLRGTVNKLEEIGINRTVGTAIGYVIMFAVLALVAFLLFSPGVGMNTQFANLIENVPVYVQGISDWANDMYARYAYMLEDESVRAFVSDVQASAMEWAGDFAKNSASGAIAFGTGLANAFMAIGFALVVAFWILMQLPQLGRECRRLVGDAHAEDLEMLHITFTRVMGGYIKGTLLQCAIIGVACGILFAVLGIPNSMALGGITGILNIIPIIGPWLGGGLAAIVGIFVSPLVAVIAILGTIVIQQFVYTFISPKIMSDSVDIHPALTLIALMAGSALGGAMGGLPGSLVGMLASIPAVAVAKSVFVYYFEKRTGRRLVSKDGVFFLGTPSSSEDGDAPNPIADATSPHPDGSAEFERAEKKRAENIERGLPEAFRALSISIGSGHSLAQAMRYVGAHAEEPVKTEFTRVGLSIDCGVPAVETLDILLSRLPVHGMDMVTLALKISKRTGAPLSGLLADAANSVGERIELRRALDVKTAQARMSAHIVSAMPMGMMAFLLLFSSDFRAGVATMPGLFCVVAALLLNVVAVVIIGKIMRMEL